MDKEQKLTNDISVPNNDMEILKKNFPQCFDKEGKFLLEKFKNNLSEKEINFSTESYGLEWLGKGYARLLASDAATTLLQPDHAHNSQAENINAENLLIKGDNLEVLKHLVGAYYEQVKMIYIDPPYNTGSDGFVYNDTRKFTAKELQNLIGVDAEKANRILAFTQSKSNSHSAWLTFIYPRLYIAKQLLKDDGVIFVSIDDNEVAQLRLLMDEVFGEENFVANVIWEKRYGRSNNAKLITTSTEHILLYRKSEKLENLKEVRRDEISGYSNPDNDTRGVWTSVSFINQVSKEERPNLSYIITNPNTGELISHPTNAWKVGKDKYEVLLTEKRLYWGSDGKAKYPRIKRFLSELDEGMVPINFWSFKEAGSVDIGTKRIKELLGFDAFTFPKPTLLIQKMLLLFNPDEKKSNSDLILDFFAGSGTTGDAVMQLNAEDGGNRKFILVQLPENIDPKKNKAAYDFVNNELHAAPTIFEITKERLLRAAKKINIGIDEKIEKLQKELPTEENVVAINKYATLKTQNCFKVFETTPIWEDYDFEAATFDSTQTLFDVGKLTDMDIKALLTTWKTYDGIALTQELEAVVLNAESEADEKTKNYIAYYGKNKLYLMNKGFTTDHLKALLQKIDTDKYFEPKSIIAFGYHMESKCLREIAENVKTYNNKKKSEIDFITRY